MRSMPPGRAAQALLIAPQLDWEVRVNKGKVGAILLTIWSGLNVLVAAWVTLATVFLGKTPVLSLLYPGVESGSFDPRLVGVIDAQAALANPCIVALCTLVLVSVWSGVLTQNRKFFWAVVIALVPLQAFGFVSDHFIGDHNLVANVISSLLLCTGLFLCGTAMPSATR
jgi:hypothetical protein